MDGVEYKTTWSQAFHHASEPEVVVPEGDGWKLVSTAVAPMGNGRPDRMVMYYTWKRQTNRWVEPCPGKPEIGPCGAIAVKNGCCVGCGRSRSQ